MTKSRWAPTSRSSRYYPPSNRRTVKATRLTAPHRAAFLVFREPDSKAPLATPGSIGARRAELRRGTVPVESASNPHPAALRQRWRRGSESIRSAILSAALRARLSRSRDRVVEQFHDARWRGEADE